jgi:hypothetical protein
MAKLTPWAILLCKFNDDTTEPQPRTFYEKLFTAAGVGSHNMVDFFGDCSHGAIDVSGSRVFGWYTLSQKRSDYVGSGPNWQGRQDLVNWARQAAANAKDDLTPFFGVVVVTNVPTDLFGGGGPQAVCGPGSLEPSVLGQEMGHGYGLAHSRIDGSEDDYRDPWDVMSTWNSCFMTSHPDYTLVGPGMNAANMRGRGWLAETRVWSNVAAASFSKTVVLRPLHRRDLPGWLAADLPGGYLVEFRMNEGWDAAIPRPAVLVHYFADNHSYLVNGTAGHPDLVSGDKFEQSSFSLTKTTDLKLIVQAIDPNARTATIQVTYEIAIHRIQEIFGIVSQGVKVDGGGWIFINGKFYPVPPRGPVTRILEQLMLFQSPDLSRAGAVAREAVRREALSAIATDLDALREETEPFHTPPALVGKGTKPR